MSLLIYGGCAGMCTFAEVDAYRRNISFSSTPRTNSKCSYECIWPEKLSMHMFSEAKEEVLPPMKTCFTSGLHKHVKYV